MLCVLTSKHTGHAQNQLGVLAAAANRCITLLLCAYRMSHITHAACVDRWLRCIGTRAHCSPSAHSAMHATISTVSVYVWVRMRACR
jgi:hypothetical protein